MSIDCSENNRSMKSIPAFQAGGPILVVIKEYSYMLHLFLCSYSSLIFIRAIVSGIFISLSRVRMFRVWVGIEIRFLGVLGIMRGESIGEAERSIKYFIIQVLGSLLFLLGVLFRIRSLLGGFELRIIIVGLFLKIGLFPFHFWVPAVICQLSWWGCLIIRVFQKIVPLWIFCNLEMEGVYQNVLEFSVIITALLGCLGGLGVIHFRVLFAYSSLIHSGFIVVLRLVSFIGIFLYLGVYFLLNLGLVFTLWCSRVYSLIDVVKVRSSLIESFCLRVSLYALSLAGLPPFSGCFLKSFFLVFCWSKFPLVSLVFMFSSGVSLYFYIRFFLSLRIYSGSGFIRIKNKRRRLIRVFFVLRVGVNIILGWPLFLLIRIF